jgi:hypothetical protein
MLGDYRVGAQLVASRALFRSTELVSLFVCLFVTIPIYKKGDRSLVSNYRPVSLTSVISKQMEYGIASYLREM